MPEYDAVIVGSGPNGLAAAIMLAQKGYKVLVLEGAQTIGGSVRSEQLTIPGFVHDTGAAIMPMTKVSPFFNSLPLTKYGLEWILPTAALAHPFDDGSAILLKQSIVETAEFFNGDAEAYRNLIDPLLFHWDQLSDYLLGTWRLPMHPMITANFGLTALQSAKKLVNHHFKSARAKGFFAGLAAHSVLPLDQISSAAIGLVLCLSAHSVNWPIPSGGAGNVSKALGAYFNSLGGTIITGHSVKGLTDLPDKGPVFYDTSPGKIADLYEKHLPHHYKKSLMAYSYGPGIFKMDWALSGPIPWKAKICEQAGTVHLGGSFNEISQSEGSAWQGKIAEKPFIILAQPSSFDDTRAGKGKHTAWAYCHVPNGCDFDMTNQMETQIERFAPGFKDLILSRHTLRPSDLQRENPNLVGGDIAGGASTIKQLLCRPVCKCMPYSVPIRGVYLCSASTPPGAGVHGMCGFHAASAFLRRNGQ
jgi:phytoene dehydrogenase-like protein